MIQMYGDVPETYKQLAKDLLEQEVLFDSSKGIPVNIIAKAYVCMAHDWYQIGMDEKGTQLLAKADQVCPGYFDNHMVQDAQDHADYAELVNNIAAQLKFMLLSSLKGNLP